MRLRNLKLISNQNHWAIEIDNPEQMPAHTFQGATYTQNGASKRERGEEGEEKHYTK